MADNVRALVIKSGTTQNIPAADSLLVGTGIDASAAGALTIGGATATSITIGSASITTDFPGPVQLTGDVTTVGGTTFTSPATFEGNVTFGAGAADTVTFAALTTITSDIAFGGAGHRVTNMLDPSSAQDGATKAYADTKLALTGGTMSGPIAMGSNLITGLTPGVAGTDAANVDQVNAIAAIEYDQQIFVAAGADPTGATGAPLRPFASVSAAMAAITDASPTKRYAIVVSAGAYTEASALNLKPNVFIVGAMKDAVRITAPSFGLDAAFTGAADNRSGAAQVILIGAATFNFGTVTSSDGKLVFQSVSFSNAVSLVGFASVNQAQFDSCLFFSTFANTGVNVGPHTNNIHFSNITLGQSATASLATFFTATGGSCGGTFTALTTVNDFGRRISVFARSFYVAGAVTIDGPSSYFDHTVDSLPSAGASTPNGGNLVSIDFGANKNLSNLNYPTAVNNPIIPASTNATNLGDWNKQWFFSFGYVHLSSGTDLYIGSAGTAAAADSAGRAVYLRSDQYGLVSNVNGGVLDLGSSNTTGTGISGNVDVNTGTSVNGNSGDITLTTGTPSGTGTRGSVVVDSPKVDLTGKITKYNNVAPTDGQVLIGNTAGARFDAATLTAGSGVTITPGAGSITIAATGSGGTVTGVTASAPLASSGGTAPDISLTGVIDVANGGTGVATITAGSLVVGNAASTVNTLSPGSNGDVLTVVAGAWASAAVPAATDYSVVTLTTAQAANTAVTVGGAAAIATAASTSRVAGIVTATNTVKVLGICTCLVETGASITAGDPVYLSASEAGKVTDVAPSTATQVVAELGIATAADASGTVTVLWQPKAIVVL